MANLAFLHRLLRNAKARRFGKYAGIASLVLLGIELAYVLLPNGSDERLGFTAGA